MLQKQSKKKFHVGITMGRCMKKELRRLRILREELVINRPETKCDDMMEHLPGGFTKDTLHKKT